MKLFWVEMKMKISDIAPNQKDYVNQKDNPGKCHL